MHARRGGGPSAEACQSQVARLQSRRCWQAPRWAGRKGPAIARDYGQNACVGAARARSDVALRAGSDEGFGTLSE